MTTESTRTAALRETWESAAPGWAKWERVISAGLADVTDMLLDMAGIESGKRVLDVACGAGDQTFRAAKRVGPAGKIIASDISPTMLEHVRRIAADAGLGNVETLECPVDELPATLEPFDAAISRLGLMLFLSPAAALGAVQRVLKPGARFAALVFSTPEKNPYFSRSMGVLLRHAGRPAPPPGSPGLFALGGDGVLAKLMSDSGLVDVEIRTAKAPLYVPSVFETLKMMQDAFGVYRAVIADLDEPRRREAWEEVLDLLQQFEVDGAFRTECDFIIGAGAKAS